MLPIYQKISKFVLLVWFFQHLPQNLHSFSVTKCFFLLSHLFSEGVSWAIQRVIKKFAQRLLLPRTMQDGYLLIKDLLYHAFVRLKYKHYSCSCEIYSWRSVHSWWKLNKTLVLTYNISLIVKVLNLECKVAVVSKFLQIIFNWI